MAGFTNQVRALTMILKPWWLSLKSDESKRKQTILLFNATGELSTRVKLIGTTFRY